MDQTIDVFLDIQRIEDSILAHINTIESENSRLTSLDTQKEARVQLQLECESNLSLQKELLSKEEKELFEIDKKLSKAHENMSAATSEAQINASEKTIATLAPKKEESEDVILELLEKIEELETKISDAKTFIQGLDNSREDIKKEVDSSVKLQNESISKLEENIENLLSLLTKENKNLFILTNKNFKFKSFVVRIKDKSCPKCGSAVDNVMYDRIVKKDGISICIGCGRILADQKY